jgi:opacity protein-like surface antigen
MRKISFVMLLILGISFFARTQVIEGANVYFSGGLSVPYKPSIFSDHWKSGFNVGFGIGFPLSSNITLVLNYDHNVIPINEPEMVGAAGLNGNNLNSRGEGGTTSILTATASMKFIPFATQENISPYIIGGIGYLFLTRSDFAIFYTDTSGFHTIIAESESEPAFTGSIGAGVDILGGKNSAVFFEIRYVLGFTTREHTGYFPMKVGIRGNI